MSSSEKIVTISAKSLYQKYTYVDIMYKDIWRQGFILHITPTERYNVIFLTAADQTMVQNDLTSKFLSFYGANRYQSNYMIREKMLNEELNEIEIDKILGMLNSKLKEINIDLSVDKAENSNFNEVKPSVLTLMDNNRQQVDLTGYYTYQFYSGFLLDCFSYINKKLSIFYEDGNKVDFSPYFIEFFQMILDTVIYSLKFTKNNLDGLLSAINNRRNLILNKNKAILASFEIILNNLILFYCYSWKKYSDINKSLDDISNLYYEILLKTETKEKIPLTIIVSLINFIAHENVYYRIAQYDKIKVYNIFLSKLNNMRESEIKAIKNFQEIKVYCSTVTTKLFQKPKNVLADKCFYTFLINCMSVKSLAKKLNVMNVINNEIMLKAAKREIDYIFYEFFINKKKFLDMFYEEDAHEELLKRFQDLFIYLAKFGKISDEMLSKLLKMKSNRVIMKKIVCEIIKNTRDIDKKNELYKKISNTFDFNENTEDMEFAAQLTLACLYKNNNINIKINQNKNNNNYSNNKNNFVLLYKKTSYSVKSMIRASLTINSKKSGENANKYYGLETLYEYIINGFVNTKTDTSAYLSQAINSFCDALNGINIEYKDIYYFMERIIINIKSNQQHNSIVQSLILLKRLILKLFDLKEERIEIIQNTRVKMPFNFFDEESEILRTLNEKYKIINLLIDDLIRYMKLIPEKNKIDEKALYEGIYPHFINIQQRLNMIFFYGVYGMLKFNKAIITKIYNIFKERRFITGRKIFFNILAINLKYIDNETLLDFFKEVMEKDTEFDIIRFNDEYTFAIIVQIFTRVNLYLGTLVNDSKNVRVITEKQEQIEGFNLLFDIIFKNKNPDIQKKISKILAHICLYVDDYSNVEYWNLFIQQILALLENRNNINDLRGLGGLARLLDNIYTLSSDFCGKVPLKEDTHKAEEKYVLYHFCCPDLNNKEYKLRVGSDDKIIDMRWKLGYYYDININDLVILDDKNRKYTFMDDYRRFYDVFPVKKYAPKENKFILIKVKAVKGQIVSIKGNPKELIDNNKLIFDILLQNLFISIENVEFDEDAMKNIWELIMKLPKQSYIEKNIMQYGDQSKNFTKEELGQIFNIKEKYILTFTLQGILEYLYKDINEIRSEEGKSQYLAERTNFVLTFINFHHIDKFLYTILMQINLTFEKNSTETIEFKLLLSLINTLKVIENFKVKKCISFNFQKIDIEITDANKTNIMQNAQEEDDEEERNRVGYEAVIDTGMNYYLDQIKDNLISTLGEDKFFSQMTTFIMNTVNVDFEKLVALDKKKNKIIEGKEFNLLDIIKNDINYYDSKNKIKSLYEKNLTSICYDLLDSLTKFIDEISLNNNIDYFLYLFKKQNLFIEIFVTDYIKCQKEELKKILYLYLYSNLFGINNARCIKNKSRKRGEDQSVINMEYITNYFNIILSQVIFKYLSKNDNDGSYFKNVASIIEKYLKEISKNKLDEENVKYCQKHNSQLKQVIDSIIDYFKKESESPSLSEDSKKSQKDSKMIGVILFTKYLLTMSPEDFITYFLNKVNLTDLFFNKYLFKKSNENPIDSENEFLYGTNVKKELMEFLIYLMQNSEYSFREKISMTIWEKIDIYHKSGFWKTDKKRDWELDYKEIPKNKYVGLKNMACTCFLNSIIQQLYMIPMLRETILNINLNPAENNIISVENTVLYQLQILFASLKTFDCKFYDPRQFVIASNLNFYEQKDADEYYSQLLNTLENDLKAYYININMTFDDKIGVSDFSDFSARSSRKFTENPYKDLFKFFFGIKVIDILNFVECGHKRYNEFYYNNIPLEVKGFSSILDSLKNFCKSEIMDGENKIICEQCKTKRVCHKTQLIKQLPNILVIVLKRFEFDYEKMTKFKLNNYFEFPLKLDMSDYLYDNTETDTYYELTGITIHYGVVDSGHYYDLIRDDKKWYMFNDINVVDFKEENIPSEAFGENNFEEMDNKESESREKGKKNAYILVYTKKDYENSSLENNNYDTILVRPPFNKNSAINKHIQKELSCLIFKEKTLEYITNTHYLNFVFKLLKLDVIKKLKNDKELQNEHSDAVDELNKGGFLALDVKNDGTENNSMKIFKFGLRYFFNVILRLPKEKDLTFYFIEIFKVYLDKDKEKCQFLLEEFSNKEAINEFLVSCPIEESVTNVLEIILYTVRVLLKEKDSKDILIKFVNGLLLYISDEINNTQVDTVIKFLFQLVNIDNIFKDHLKQSKIKQWMKKVISEKSKCNEKLSKSDFPKLDYNKHLILVEKVMPFNFGKITENDDEQTITKKKKDVNKNFDWIKQIERELN